MAETLAELRALSDEEIIARHDAAVRPPLGEVYRAANDYLAELARRDQDRQTKAMLEYTRSIKTLTLVVTVATVLGFLVSLASFVVVVFSSAR
jgi:hypothetical protein